MNCVRAEHVSGGSGRCIRTAMIRPMSVGDGLRRGVRSGLTLRDAS